jgi:hypothetical protein
VHDLPEDWDSVSTAAPECRCFRIGNQAVIKRLEGVDESDNGEGYAACKLWTVSSGGGSSWWCLAGANSRQLRTHAAEYAAAGSAAACNISAQGPGVCSVWCAAAAHATTPPRSLLHETQQPQVDTLTMVQQQQEQEEEAGTAALSAAARAAGSAAAGPWTWCALYQNRAASTSPPHTSVRDA